MDHLFTNMRLAGGQTMTRCTVSKGSTPRLSYQAYSV